MRPATPPPPVLVGAANGKRTAPQTGSSPAISLQDAVEVQWNSADRVLVYEFVNQQGSLILQIPSQELLSLAEVISQELAQAGAGKAAAPVEGGQENGH